uniref:F-box domain-containing protein n=1 Tax=Panagrolaimus sp. JU765 TaxID=591449 RepID=A0AC34PWF2_9BILA
MEYFNFLGLPEVVQDLIVHEIVHNSIPNDRIQLARTCKYLNEAVKRAKPKKIILQQFQVEKLIMSTNSLYAKETQCSELFHRLFEASKFVTELEFCHYSFFPEFTAFYNKFEHLDFLDFSGTIEMFNSLSHLPSKIKVYIVSHYDPSLLENITKKTTNNPLSSLFIDDCIPVADLQRFLQATKLKNGCEIYFKVRNSKGKRIHVFMTFIDDEHGFEIETFPEESSLIVADQKYDERVTFINDTLGCQISVIKVEELIGTIQKLKKGRIPLPDLLRENNRKRGPPSFFEDESQ